jgi:hypothetical protein
VLLLGKTIRLLPNADGELRAADDDQPADPVGVERYLEAFGDHLADIRAAMEELAGRYDLRELNRIGFRLYEKFRPEIPHGNEATVFVHFTAAVIPTESIRYTET